MKRLLTLVLAAMAFVACTQNEVEELTDNRVALPETITGGFEGGDTRIELNEALKTVWTEGDEVSVFYRSYENMCWAFQGETGDRSGELRLVSGEAGEQTMDNVVVVYPYSETYVIDITNGYVEASLPAVQSYKEGSYGAEGNIMVAESDYRQFTLKSVVGWLRVELTGEGESVKSITLRGNAGEQVAGDILVNAADASCILASEGAAAEDNSEVAGNLMLEESILTEMTLNCGSGVMLGSEAKSFYIGLLPQTFEEGITVEVECGNGTSTTKSTADKLVVERNHIVPMASFKFDGVLPEVYELAYTTNDGMPLDPYTTEGFGGEFMENIYDAATGRGVLKFAGAITTIPEHAFGLCENLTWIDLPEGIKYIYEGAFKDCSAMESVTIPTSVIRVDTEAFMDCPCMAIINCNIVGREIVDTDNEIAFENAGFTKVVIGDNVTTIGDSAFWYCSSLTSVTIPDSVTTIGDYAFAYCADLTSVTIPDSVTTIGGGAFYNCNSLTSVTIPDSVTTIGNNAFYGCESLTSITIPDSVTTIGDQAFRGCSSLTSVTIPDSVTTIGDWAFCWCTSLTSVYCKATTPPTLGSSIVFSENESGRKIYVPEGSLRAYKMAEYWSEYADYIVGYDFGAGDEVIVVKSKLFYTAMAKVEPHDASAFNVAIVSNEWDEATGEGVITFDGELTTIGSSAFENCDSLTSVTIPESVTTIGVGAFNGCSSLTSVTIPDSITTIGEGAFYECSSLTSVVIPDSVTTIGEGAFSYCTSLTSVTIPDSVTTIGEGAFYECSSLTSVTIPDSVTTIGNAAFLHCTSLTSVTIPESVTTIGEGAFKDCDSLTSVTIPDSVTTIGDMAFYGCNNLTSITIGDSVTTIGNAAFKDCNNLTSVTIPESVTTIGEGVFKDCARLTSVTIPDSVTTIGGAAFGGCVSLTSVTIPESVTTIGDIAFAHCLSLTSVTIGDSVTTIGDMAFEDCDRLTSVTIPDSVTTIGVGVFLDCESLTSVYCKAITPPTLGRSVFYGNKSGRKIYVPAESVEAYKAAENWSEYADDIVGYDFGAGEEVIVVKSELFYTSTALVEPDEATAFNVAIVSNEWDETTGEGVITFDGELTTIGEWAFYDCGNLTSVTIPESVTTIGDYAFRHCSSLTSVTIPKNTTTIGEGAFIWCESLTSVTIPNNVTTIGNGAFAACISLAEFKGKFAADGGRCLIKDNTIIAYANASGTTYTIGDSVTSIGEGAFHSCSSLTSVTIPESVTTIGDHAFIYCDSLTSVYCEATTPPAGGVGMFYDTSATIYVPEDSLREYKMAENWSEYADYIVGYNFETGEVVE